jgi:hypothetical protein
MSHHPARLGAQDFDVAQARPELGWESDVKEQKLCPDLFMPSGPQATSSSLLPYFPQTAGLSSDSM